MLAGKTLTDYTALFSPYDFNKNDQIMMHEIDKTKLSDQTKFRLYEIKKMRIILSMRLMKENYTIKNWVNMLLFLIT